MNVFARAALVAALTLAAAAQAQHAAHHPDQPRAGAPNAAPAEEPRGGRHYRSAFTGYRPFDGEVSLKDWKKANDEVREVGGHVGLLKGEPAQLQGHGAHGAKRQAPPVQQK